VHADMTLTRQDRGQGQGSHEIGKIANIFRNRSSPFGRGGDNRLSPLPSYF